MSEGVIVAIVSGICTLLGSGLGVVASNKLTTFRLQQLENKVEKHNEVVERTFRLEGQVTEIFHDIKELKSYHKQGGI